MKMETAGTKGGALHTLEKYFKRSLLLFFSGELPNHCIIISQAWKIL